MTRLDVRDLPPAQRHERILAAFEALPPGEELTLINDHEPRPLYHQFRAEVDGFDADGYGVERRADDEFVAVLPKAPSADGDDVGGDGTVDGGAGGDPTADEDPRADGAGRAVENAEATAEGAEAAAAGEEAVDDDGAAEADVVLDAREVDEEPFGEISATLAALEPGETFLLRNGFEPVPLYDVLEERGFEHETERRGDDEWLVRITHA